MLDFIQMNTNTWVPPLLTEKDTCCICKDCFLDNDGTDIKYLIIMQTEPYIDSIYVHFTAGKSIQSMYKNPYYCSFDEEA